MALTFKDLQDHVLSEFDDTSTEFIVDVKRALNRAQKKVSIECDWPFLHDSATITTVAGQQEYSLTSAFRKMHSVTRDNAYLQGVDPELFDRIIPYPSASGDPTFYTLFKHQKIQLYPIPASSGSTIYYKFYKMVTEMSADGDYSDIPDQYREILIHYALYRLFLKDSDDRATLEKIEFDNMLITMMNDLNPGTGIDVIESEDSASGSTFPVRLDPDHFHNP